jgi:TPR repeat protein
MNKKFILSVLTIALSSGSVAHANAASALPQFCEDGKCSAEFLNTYEKAKSGDSVAQNHAGEMLLFGNGVQVNYDGARQLFEESSKGGNAVAPNHLGRLYLNGEGVAKNPSKACYWYEISAERGDTAGKQNAGWCHSKGISSAS